ncbi:hypothetical protein [Asanoa siamensis]|uniref:hypothetical protein n=1 Tax=Asanoa siamensis TaxID=926357 RepID=UPI001942C982|nr:hypothetical protein [Asanoa siamensis]
MANEVKATKRPSAFRLGSPLAVSAWRPPLETLTRSRAPFRRSYRKMSEAPLVSWGARLLANEVKATNRPSPLIAGLV